MNDQGSDQSKTYFVWHPPTLLATPATLNLFDNPGYCLDCIFKTSKYCNNDLLFALFFTLFIDSVQ